MQALFFVFVLLALFHYMPGVVSAPTPLAPVEQKQEEKPIAKTTEKSAQKPIVAVKKAEAPVKIEQKNEPVTVPPLTTTLSLSEQIEIKVHEKVNIERAKQGLTALSYDNVLASVARAHSKDMHDKKYFAHENLDGCSSSCRITNAGYEWRAVGENIFMIKSSYTYSAEDASSVIVQGWMGSDGHRRNILDSNFTYEGIGVYVENGAIYATENFARPR